MKSLLTALLIITISTTLAQEAQPIVTEVQNSHWLQKLSDRELEGKIEMIRQRWEADKDITFYVTAVLHQRPSGKKGDTRWRPLYLFTNGNNKSIIFSSNPSSEEISMVSKIMVQENISEVELIQGIKAQALYGQRGSSGVIFIKLRENAVFESLASQLNPKEQ